MSTPPPDEQLTLLGQDGMASKTEHTTVRVDSSAGRAVVVSAAAVQNAVFDAQLARLNEAQCRAVETIDGPVMVIAGPGTGKTQVVGMRVANILRRTQMRPGNILCLTFSNSGATAMRERLRSLIGPDAYGVKVATIHGFCNEIIGQHPHVFEEWAAMEQISDIERYRELNAIIDGLMPHLALVNRKHPHGRTRDILGRISQMKREGKDDFEELRRIADDYDVQMAGKSKSGTKAHEKNVLQARKFREFLTIYERYQEMLSTTDRYDYDDMILHVIHALQEEDWLLASLQERYQYILVDEFQDTNGAQYRFIELLTTSPTPDNAPNLFVVGDDDQAIYRFQGANLTNLLNFHHRFPQAPVIVLTENYRSTQAILDAAGSLIAQNTERLVGRIDGLQKNLHSPFSILHSQFPRLLYAPSNAMEPWLIADVVEQKLQQGIPAQEIAVLTRTNAELRPLYDVLRARNLAVQLVGKIDLLTHPLVQQLLSVLKAIYHPEDSALLASAVACEQFGCHPADLGRLFALRRERSTTLMKLLMDLENIHGTQGMMFHDIDTVMAVRNCLLDLHHKIGSRTVIDTLERVLKDCHFLGVMSDDQPALDPLDFSALQAFFDHVCARAHEQPHYAFGDLMNDLYFYEQPEYGELRLQYVVPHLSEHGVQLMTAHQSKGLEFDTVIIANFREGQWDKRRDPPSLSIPEDLLFGWEKEQKDYERNQDERRIAFVAMTRAKRELLFTCPREMVAGDKARQVAPSAFFAEAGQLPEEECEIGSPETSSLLLRKPVRDLPMEFRAFLRERLENFDLSVSALNRFLEDPQEFLAIDLLQMPQAVQEEFLYGTAVHSALRHWGLSIQQGQPVTSKGFFHVFEQSIMDEVRATEAIRRNLVAEGRDSLPRYYDERLSVIRPVIFKVEYPIRAHLADGNDPSQSGIPLKGFIDRIDLDYPDAKGATVIDYKTGKPKTEGEIRDSDLYRQLTFYSLLFNLGHPLVEPHTYVLEFIGGGSEYPVSRAFQIPDADREELKKLIRDVWAKIQALDFTTL